MIYSCFIWFNTNQVEKIFIIIIFYSPYYSKKSECSVSLSHLICEEKYVVLHFTFYILFTSENFHSFSLF